VVSRAYAFIDPHRVLGTTSTNAAEAGVFSFPDGHRLQKFMFFADDIKPTGNPNYFVIKPLQHTKMGLFDLKAEVIAAGMNIEDATVWDNRFIFESVSGKLVVREMTGTGKETKIDGREVASVDIPVASVGDLSAAQVSNSFRWLALSSKTRGGLWDLATGDRKVYSTGFRGGIVGDDGGTVAEFPRWDPDLHALALLNPIKDEVTTLRELPPKASKQFGRFVFSRISLRPPAPEGINKQDNKKDEDRRTTATFEDSDPVLRENVRYELKDFVENKVIWSQDFPKDSPQYSFDSYSGRLVLYWGLGSDTGKAKLNENADLKARSVALGNKDNDYLVEVIDAFAAKPIGQMLIETGKGSFDVGQGISEGDWLVFYDSSDRVLVYSIKTGELRHRFFGGKAALNPNRNQIAVENLPGEISVFNLETGDLDRKFVIKGKAVFLRFNLQGERLFVLSDLQTAYAFDVRKSPPQKG
jgi:hypothetical protein